MSETAADEGLLHQIAACGQPHSRRSARRKDPAQRRSSPGSSRVSLWPKPRVLSI